MSPSPGRKGFLDTMVARLIALLIVALGIALLVYSNRDRLEEAQAVPDEAQVVCVNDKFDALLDAHPEDDPLTDFDRKLYRQRAESECGQAS